jgi:Ni/Co efflux regulator RcnB
MRIGSAVLSLAVAGTFLLPMATAQAAPREQTAQKSQSAGDELSAQSRRVRRPPPRLRVYPSYPGYSPDDVYPRYFPGRNAVRDCTATLVQEFRPSGTVITPRMHCFWRPG